MTPYTDYVNKLLEQSQFQFPKVGNKDDQAHSPIHPVKKANEGDLQPKEWKIYDLISRHFLACCSKDATGEESEVIADVGG